MAGKSNNSTVKKENDAAETKSLNAASGEKRVPVWLPRIPGAPEDEFYSVNGVDYIIKRGVTVEVPESLAEGIRNGQNAQAAAFEFTEQLHNQTEK